MQQQSKQPELTAVSGDRKLPDSTAKTADPTPAQKSQQETGTAVTKSRGFKEETFDKVMQQITSFTEEGSLNLPQGYSPSNALRAAWLILQDVKDRNNKPALEVCTKESICNALLKMVVWGLSPLKKQADFIVRGSQLCCDPEYTGNLLLAKRYGHLKEDGYKARAIFKGDIFEFEVEGQFPYRTRITKHEQKLENIGGEVIGAYFAYELENGAQDVEIMNISQIRNAWLQGSAKGDSGAHNKFSDQMAIKTVINRGTKLLIRSSDDKPLFFTEDEDRKDDVQEQAVAERTQKANKKELSFEDAEEVKDAEPSKDPESKQETSGKGPGW